MEDETDLLLFPPLRSAWAKVGEPTPVLLRGHNQRRVVFGAMDLRTGDRLFVERERQRSADFQVLLHAVRHRYGSRAVVMLLDEDPSHTARASLALAEELGIQFLWLPKRAPELNPMELLWRDAKDLISANRQYQTIEEQVHRFLSYLKSFPNEEALGLSGVLSGNFWLNHALSNYF